MFSVFDIVKILVANGCQLWYNSFDWGTTMDYNELTGKQGRIAIRLDLKLDNTRKILTATKKGCF